MVNIETPEDIKKELDRFIVGQEDVKKTLSIVGFNHLLKVQPAIAAKRNNEIYIEKAKNVSRASNAVETILEEEPTCDKRCNEYKEWLIKHKHLEEEVAKAEALLKSSSYIENIEIPLLPKINSMILGPTGSGKTLSGKALASILGVPFIYIPSGKLDHTGNDQGNSFKDYLKKAYQDCESYSDTLLDYSVVFFDEIDKLYKTAGQEISSYNEGIRTELLSILEGDTYKVGTTINTHNMLFICAGTFSHVNPHLTVNPEIGFKGSVNPKTLTMSKEFLSKHSGCSEEFLGRMHVITQTKPLSKEELHDIVFKVEGNLFSLYSEYFKALSVDLTEDTCKEVLEKIAESKFGARDLNTVMFDHLKDRMFNVKKRKVR